MIELPILTERGKKILKIIEEAAEKTGTEEGDFLEMTMLAFSFQLYFDCAEFIKANGVSMTFTTKEGGEYSQVRPEYTTMKTEYSNILKHSGKFGLNPAARKRIFNAVKPEKESEFDKI